MSTVSNNSEILPVSKINSFFSSISIGKTFLYLIVSLLLATCVVLSALKQVNFVFVFSIIILTFLFFILFTTMGSNILSLSLPFSAYPPPPHLNLDGVSPNTYLIGKQL